MAKRSSFKAGDKVLNDRYEILKLLHSSGMANVYLVSDSNLNKQWCLKEIRKSEAGRDEVEYHSLLQEATIMKSLNHANIPRITTIEQDNDSIFIVMDYVDGISIKSWLLKKGRISQEIVVAWMKQIVQVVSYLHNRKQPIFYRDMKPDNVMVQSDGSIKLLDFGISIVIKEKGQTIDKALGTKGYAAPEQKKRGSVCDLRSDIYALGKTMYYMLTGLNPGQLPEDKLKSVREIDASISVGLEEIVNKCTQEDPNLRYQDCEELLYALQNYQSLDINYRKGIKKKCALTLGMMGVSLAMILSSFIPLSLYRKQQNDEYIKLVAIAKQSSKLEDYENVLDLNPMEFDMYNGLITTIKVDGSFSQEEEEILLGYINPNLEELRESSEYPELAFELGKLYWFYYDSETEDEGMINSVKWFNDAKNLGYEPELSEVYYQLGSFKKNIMVSVTESEDIGMYRDYWDSLLKARTVDKGEIVTLQLNLSIVNCINSYTYNLLQDGIEMSEICDVIQDIKSYTETYSPSIEKTQDLYSRLKETLNGLEGKVKSVYKE